MTLFQQPWPDGEHRLFQLGFVVDDVVAQARRWAEVFGVGPFRVLPARDATMTYRRTTTSVPMQIAVAQAGPVQIELIAQLDDQPSVFRELAGKGPCRFHQVCTVTPDVEGTLARYRASGFEVAAEIPSERGMPGLAYVDTYAAFGFFTEVVEATPSFLQQVAAIAATCAAWDGTDPVRLLTRDGYEPL